MIFSAKKISEDPIHWHSPNVLDGVDLHNVHGITPYIAPEIPRLNEAQFLKDVHHPGLKDPEYVEQRNQIARVAMLFGEAKQKYLSGSLSHRPNIPTISYQDVQHDVWRVALGELIPLWKKNTVSAYLNNFEVLEDAGVFSRYKIPQLQIVSQFIEKEMQDRFKARGIRMEPVFGLVHPVDFLAALADFTFLSTQYIRHHSCPLYTPEPDIIHELLGHAVMFLDPHFAEVNYQFGLAAKRLKAWREAGGMSDLEYEDEGSRLGALYWFTVEFGVVKEEGTIKAVGAGLFSSFGELKNLEDNGVALKPTPEHEARSNFEPLFFAKFDPFVMMNHTEYDVTQYQTTLYLAESYHHWHGTLTHFLSDLYHVPFSRKKIEWQLTNVRPRQLRHLGGRIAAPISAKKLISVK